MGNSYPAQETKLDSDITNDKSVEDHISVVVGVKDCGLFDML